MKRALAGAVALIALLALPGAALAKPEDGDTHVQLLAINDLHGHLQPTTPGTIQTGCCVPVRNTSGVQTGWTQNTVPAVGNHEFDEGIEELQRMRYGNERGGDGCHPVDGCQDGTPFGGSLFPYLAANVFFAGTDTTILPPYEVRKLDNVKIGFIGLTFEGTPTVVTPSAVDGLDFR